MTKPFTISKALVWNAFQQVKAKGGCVVFSNLVRTPPVRRPPENAAANGERAGPDQMR
jgi:hypothetical protein